MHYLIQHTNKQVCQHHNLHDMCKWDEESLNRLLAELELELTVNDTVQDLIKELKRGRRRQLQSYEELLLQDLKMTAELIKQKTQSRNNMITHLFDARGTTKMTVENIAEAAGVSRKHVYTIVNKEGNDGKV